MAVLWRGSHGSIMEGQPWQYYGGVAIDHAPTIMGGAAYI